MGSKEVIKRLKQEGFEIASQKGSHAKLRHPDGRTVIVPTPRKDLPTGTLESIWKQAGIKP